MSTKPSEPTAVPVKSKKRLLIIIAVVLLALALAGFAALVYINKQRAAQALDLDEHPAAAQQAPSGPPAYLPLDNLVVNLADPGGERVAQVGITFELLDAAAVEKMKQYLPTIRSSVLLLVSQRTAEELLQREGKEKLANDILREAARPFGGLPDNGQDAEEGQGRDSNKSRKAAPKAKHNSFPVQKVLFSSFIVQ